MKTLILCAALLMTACAPLSKHDTILGDAGEVVGRVLLCPLTFCVSEWEFKQVYEKEQQQRAYWTWYDTLTPEQQAVEDQRKHERSIAAMHSLGMALSHQGPIFQMPQQRPRFIPYQDPQPTMTFPTRCTSQQLGTTIHTNCY